MVPLFFLAEMASAPVVQSQSKWLGVSNGGLQGEGECIESVFEGRILETHT
jgi:hypothetical protein